MLGHEDRSFLLHFDRTQWHDRMAVDGTVRPVSGWSITKENADKLKLDGMTIDLTSFAELADRIL